MQRIPRTTLTSAPSAAQPVLENIKAKFGMVPNIFATVANSPAALKALMGMFGSLEEGALVGQPHEAIALRVAEINGCEYCAAAHTGNAKMAGASEAETIAFRKGKADDPKIQALLDLAALFNEKHGDLSDQELAAARAAGLSDAEILEALAIVICNVFTNSINTLAQTELDFPPAPTLE